MRVERVEGVVRRGWGMRRGRSGREVVKRIMRFRGGMVGGEVEGEEKEDIFGGEVDGERVGVCRGELSGLGVSSRCCRG